MGATVTVKKLTEPDALHCKYRGQYQPQPAELELDTRDGELTCAYNPNIGGGSTFDHLHRLILSCPIPVLTADAANQLMDAVAPLAQQVLDGAGEEWNGNNYVATFTPEAEAAWELIVDQCGHETLADESLAVVGWDAADWFSEGDQAVIDDLGITADTTDDRLKEITDEQVETAKYIGHAGYSLLDHDDAYGYLEALRDGLRDDARQDLEALRDELDDVRTRWAKQIRRIKAWGDERDTLRVLAELAGVSHTQIGRILDVVDAAGSAWPTGNRSGTP